MPCFLAVESVILGREAMGETVRHARLHDRWRIRRNGGLIFADDVAFDGPPPGSPATLGDARAFATVVLVSPRAEDLIGKAAHGHRRQGRGERLVWQAGCKARRKRRLRIAEITHSSAHAAGGSHFFA